MRSVIWQRVVPVGLFAIIAIGPGIASRADDAAEPEHTDAAHATDHDHADDADAEAGHEEHAAGEEHHIDTNRPPIYPNQAMGQLFVFSLLFFLLYLFLARKFAWLPLIAGLDSREARVNRALADAEAARIEAMKLLADHQKHLDQVTEQVQGIIATARGEAEQEKARIIAEAEVETTAMRDQAIADIRAAYKQSLEGLDERINAQVATATEHVLG